MKNQKSLASFDPRRRLSAILSQSAPVLPDHELRAFVAGYFDRRDRCLQVLDDHAAPIYLLERSVLGERARRFRTAFENVLAPVAFYFAVKSNNHPAVARTMLENQFGLDVSSGLELQTALDLGARDLVLSGPGKTVPELRLAAAHSEQVVVLLDSFGELRRLEETAAGLNRTVRCGIRLTVNPHGLWRKFGIALDDLGAFWEAAGQCPHIRLTGLQFHSSWNLSPQPQMDFLQDLGSALAQMPAAFHQAVQFIDIGGGYWPEAGEWLHARATPRGRLMEALGGPAEESGLHHRMASTAIENFAAQLAAAIKKTIFPIRPWRICLEPGRWICHDAMHLLLSVVDKKAPDLVITDAGTNAIGWERFESDYFPVLNLSRPSLEEHACHILGSLCTPHDVWGYTYFGAAIEPGDILMIPTQGAYTYSLRQDFIKPLPRVVVI
jgi:diaminopimelate decarboxylase